MYIYCKLFQTHAQLFVHVCESYLAVAIYSLYRLFQAPLTNTHTTRYTQTAAAAAAVAIAVAVQCTSAVSVLLMFILHLVKFKIGIDIVTTQLENTASD